MQFLKTWLKAWTLKPNYAIQILVSPLASCVISGKSLSYSERHFFNFLMWNGSNITYLLGLLEWLFDDSMSTCKVLGEENGKPLQYSCLENSMDSGSQWATIHGVTKSRTWLRDLHTHTHTHTHTHVHAHTHTRTHTHAKYLELWLVHTKGYMLVIIESVSAF